MTDTGRRVLHGLGELLITAGVVVLLFAGYELWATGLYTSHQQSALAGDLHEAWADVPTISVTATPVPVAPAQLGQGIAILHVPRLGPDWTKVVLEGVSRDILKKGPGHVPGTAAFGQVGNAVVSGHRTTYGAPFGRFAELRPGDLLVVETATSWFTYRLRYQEVVQPTAAEVLLPVPHQPGVAPTEALLTLTTCHPRFSAAQRLITVAALVESRGRGAGPPAALSRPPRA